MRIPLGRPSAAKVSPLTPAVVAPVERRRWIALSVSVPGIASLESAGCSAYRPPGRGAVRTCTTTGPCMVNCTCFSYVTPGISTCRFADAAGATKAADRSANRAAKMRIGRRTTAGQRSGPYGLPPVRLLGVLRGLPPATAAPRSLVPDPDVAVERVAL